MTHVKCVPGIRVCLFSALLAGVLGIFMATLASAHSHPVRLDPAAGAVLSDAPPRVTGWFTQPLRRDANWTFIQVTDAQGARVDAGDVSLSADRKQISVALIPGLPDGRYLVSWRVWDDSDDTISGDCYYFFVGQAAADAAVAANIRLDGGAACPRIDISAQDGTPAAGGTPRATAAPAGGEGHTDGAGEEVPAAGTSADASDDIPLWGLVVGVIGGVIAGGIGGRLLGGRS